MTRQTALETAKRNAAACQVCFTIWDLGNEEYEISRYQSTDQEKDFYAGLVWPNGSFYEAKFQQATI